VDATLNYARGIATDTNGNLFIADANNNVIRKVDQFGVITTVVGNGTFGFGGDLGFVEGANLFNPYDVAVDGRGHIFIADANNERIRKTYYATEGVGNVTKNSAVAVHPNPFANQLSVSGLSKLDKVCVYDALGKQVSELFTVAQDGTSTFTLNGLASGVYILQVSGSDGSKKASVQAVKE
jgi:hypothetical protein